MSEKKANTAVFFTTDYGFLIPTVAAALQVREQSRSDADILIFLVDFPGSESNELNDEFGDKDIRFIGMQSSVYENSKGYYHKTHVPKSTLARLCVGEMIPEQYENLIYLDGDIQIVGEISAFLKWKVRPGYILAGLDQGMLEVGEPLNGTTGPYAIYAGALGVKSPFEYFNAGVMAFRRSTLLQEGPVALEYFQANSDKCIQHDQSALNAVFGDRREYLSPRYNFMPRFHAIGAKPILQPAIMHFADRNKPWHEPVEPWLAEYAPVYTKVMKEHTVLAKYAQYLGRRPGFSAYKPSALKTAALNLAFPVRRLARRRKLRAFMEKTQFAFE